MGHSQRFRHRGKITAYRQTVPRHGSGISGDLHTAALQQFYKSDTFQVVRKTNGGMLPVIRNAAEIVSKFFKRMGIGGIGAILYKQLPILHLQLNYSLFVALKRKPHAHIAHSIWYFYTNTASNISSIIQFVKQKIQGNNLCVTTCLSLAYVEWYQFFNKMISFRT